MENSSICSTSFGYSGMFVFLWMTERFFENLYKVAEITKIVIMMPATKVVVEKKP